MERTAMDGKLNRRHTSGGSVNVVGSQNATQKKGVPQNCQQQFFGMQNKWNFKMGRNTIFQNIFTQQWENVETGQTPKYKDTVIGEMNSDRGDDEQGDNMNVIQLSRGIQQCPGGEGAHQISIAGMVWIPKLQI